MRLRRVFLATAALALLGTGIAAAPAHAAPRTTYVVRSGDTLSAIAKKYHTTVATLASLNKLTDVNKIYPGEKLLISASAAPTLDPHYAPGTTVTPSQSQQVLVADHVTGSTGTWARYQWNGKSWTKVNASATSIFGKNGVVVGSQRVQGSDTTPAGTYPLLSAFGPKNPGAHLRYQTVSKCSWWIEDAKAPDYNRWREDCTPSTTTQKESEHLADYTGNLYRQAVVIGFNYDHPIRTGKGSGAGIFLHYATRYTGGCVGINNSAELTATVQWLDPARHPVIVIKT